MGRRARATLAACVAASAGCSLWLGLEPLGYDPPAPTDIDAADDDAISAMDGRSVGPAEGDGASVDAGDGAVPPGPPFDDAARWTSYAGLGTDWWAGTFDGRYVYFLRNNGVRIARYDTQQENAFDQAVAWTIFDPSTVSSAVGKAFALTFDGRFVILANYETSDLVPDGTFLRYDTTSGGAFDAASSWEAFDTKTLTSASGRYVASAGYADAAYFGPPSFNRPYLKRSGAQLDAGWEPYLPPFDASACNKVHFGAACAGDFVYFAPGSPSNLGDCVVRVSVKQSFGDPASWECFSLGAIGPDVSGMQGAASDGKFVYLTEVGKGLGDASDEARRIARHPAASALDAGWQFRDTRKTNPLLSHARGGTFDGRYVYFAPLPDNGTTVYLRYDTLRAFDDDAAWESVASAQVLLLEATHSGALFDGKYVYFAPLTGRAVRYRARDDHAYVSSCSAF